MMPHRRHCSSLVIFGEITRLEIERAINGGRDRREVGRVAEDGVAMD